MTHTPRGAGARFLKSLAEWPASPNNCVLCPYTVSSIGYAAHVRIDGVSHRGHVWSLILTAGEKRDESHITRHACDVRRCVNPSHLIWGTYAENSHDQIRGDGTTKLTPDQVLNIRNRHAAGETQTDIAADYAIGSPQVSRIVRGGVWSDVDGPIRVHRKPLTGAERQDIRERYRVHGETLQQLADEFGMTKSSLHFQAIRDLRKGRRDP